jgi:hypothetical protein
MERGIGSVDLTPEATDVFGPKSANTTWEPDRAKNPSVFPTPQGVFVYPEPTCGLTDLH